MGESKKILSEKDYLGPFTAIPKGWYCVAYSKHIKKGRAYPITCFGEEMVLFRDNNKEVHMVEAYCTHMGAHLTNQKKSKICGNHLVCPFHGFAFDGSGQCVDVPYGTKQDPIKKLNLRAWQVIEMNGLILAFHHAATDEVPDWSPPLLDSEGWSSWQTLEMPMRSHPQEISENSVDFGHFGEVHQFFNLKEMDKVRVEGERLYSKYSFQADMKQVGLRKLIFEYTLDIMVVGLGYSVVESDIPTIGTKMRILIMPMPVDESHVVLRAAVQTKGQIKPINELLARFMFLAVWKGLRDDRAVWQTKKYLPSPILVKNDGAVGIYRKYCRQFYVPSPVANKPAIRAVEIAGSSSQ